MKFKRILGVFLATVFVFMVSTTQANAKILKYRTTSSNSFSYKTYHQAFMYGGYEGRDTQLYTTLWAAAHPTTAASVSGFYGVFSDPGYEKTFYARKVKGYPKVMQLKYGKNTWYVSLLDANLYRYNTWRSGHKLISLLPPTDKKHVMLKAHTHVYSSQPWWYNWAFKAHPYYDKYRYSSSHGWYVYD